MLEFTSILNGQRSQRYKKIFSVITDTAVKWLMKQNGKFSTLCVHQTSWTKTGTKNYNTKISNIVIIFSL